MPLFPPGFPLFPFLFQPVLPNGFFHTTASLLIHIPAVYLLIRLVGKQSPWLKATSGCSLSATLTNQSILAVRVSSVSVNVAQFVWCFQLVYWRVFAFYLVTVAPFSSSSSCLNIWHDLRMNHTHRQQCSEDSTSVPCMFFCMASYCWPASVGQKQVLSQTGDLSCPNISLVK